MGRQGDGLDRDEHESYTKKALSTYRASIVERIEDHCIAASEPRRT